LIVKLERDVEDVVNRELVEDIEDVVKAYRVLAVPLPTSPFNLMTRESNPRQFFSVPSPAVRV
jgi:hypothetical protein